MATNKQLEDQVKTLKKELENALSENPDMTSYEERIASLTAEISTLKEQIRKETELEPHVGELISCNVSDRLGIASRIMAGYTASGGQRQALANPDYARFLAQGCLALADYLIQMDQPQS